MIIRRRLIPEQLRGATACGSWLLAALAIFGFAPPASAELRAHPIMPVGAGDSLGDAHLRTEVSDGEVAVQITAPAVELPPGAELRLVSCVQTHLVGSAPAAACTERDADTRGQTTATAVAAPVAARRVAIPSAAERGWATGVVEVLRRTSSGGWQRTASSWIPGSLATAALPLSDAGLPQPLEPQGIALEAIADGGMNTGARDSICAPLPGEATDPLPDGVISGALGAAGPAYSETGAPPDGVEERGVVLLLHGGGWTLTGSWAAAGMRPDADRWRARGWRTVNASYRACGGAIDDVVAFVDHIRTRIPDDRPLCIVGTSAGAHLALVAAARRPAAVDCVVSQSGPTDLAALAGEQAHDPFTGERWTTGPGAVHNLAVAAFGAENLATMSPARQPIAARVLLALGEHDWLLAPSQATAFTAAQRLLNPAARVHELILEAGDVAWGHGAVSAAAIDAFHAAEADVADAAIADRRPLSAAPPVAPPLPPPTPASPPAPAPLGLAQPTAPLASLLAAPRPRAHRGGPSRKPLVLVTPARVHLRDLVAGRPLRVRVRAGRAGVIRVSIVIAGRAVARARRTARGARSSTLALRLDRRARAQLRRSARRSLSLNVTAVLHDRSGAGPARVTRTIQLVR